MTAKRKTSPPPDKSFRDDVALRVMTACMADQSRLMAANPKAIEDSEKAASFIAAFSYLMADAMVLARRG